MMRCAITEVANLSTRQESILKEMRNRISEVFGVTLQGNRLTVRFYLDSELVDIHMVILDIMDEREPRACTAEQPR